MTKLAIFDLDGTLLDTVQDLGEATNHALRTLGFKEREGEEYKILCGKGIYNLFKAALPEGASTEDNVKKMASLFLPYYDEHKCDYTRPYAGIIEMLDTITEAGVRIALASNKYQEGAEKLVKHFFRNYDFLKIMGQEDGRPIKPDPAIVDIIIAEDGAINKNEVVYIGDSNVDMQTGINAGVRTIGVTWGFRSRKELEAYSPWRIAESPAELKDFVLEEN